MILYCEYQARVRSILFENLKLVHVEFYGLRSTISHNNVELRVMPRNVEKLNGTPERNAANGEGPRTVTFAIVPPQHQGTAGGEAAEEDGGGGGGKRQISHAAAALLAQLDQHDKAG